MSKRPSRAVSKADLMREARAKQRSITIPECLRPGRRAVAISGLYRFWRTYFWDASFCDPAPAHRQWCEAFEEAIRYRRLKAVAAPRGGCKTTIAATALLWAVLSGRSAFPLFVSGSGPEAIERIDWVKHQLLTNDLLLEDFPRVCAPIRAALEDSGKPRTVVIDGVSYRPDWRKDYIVFPDVPGSEAAGRIIAGTGIFGRIRGRNVKGTRPDLIIVDDPQKSADASSPAIQARLEKALFSDIGGMGGHTKGLAVFCLVTLIEKDDIADRLTDPQVSPAWAGIRDQALPSMPDNMDMWETYRAMCLPDDPTWRRANRYYLDNRKAMDAGAVEFWPEGYMRDLAPDNTMSENSWLQHCMNFWAKWGKAAFWSELQNQPIAITDTDMMAPDRVKAQLSERPQCVIPPETVCVVRAYDLHDKEIHHVTMAKTADGRHQIIDYGIINVYADRTDTSLTVREGIKESLDILYQDEKEGVYADDDGLIRHIDLQGIDSGYLPDVAYNFVKKHLDCRAMKGEGAMTNMRAFGIPSKASHETRVSSEYWYTQLNRQTGVWLFHSNADYWKLRVHEGFLASIESPGSISLFGDQADEHRTIANHIATSEIYDYIARKWKKNPRYKWNHFFDCAYMCLVLCDIFESGGKTVTKKIKLSEWARGGSR